MNYRVINKDWLYWDGSEATRYFAQRRITLLRWSFWWTVGWSDRSRMDAWNLIRK